MPDLYHKKIDKDISITENREAYHVGRSEIAHDEFKFARLDNLGDLVCDALSTHFRLLVICRHLTIYEYSGIRNAQLTCSPDLGGWYHVTLLAFILLLHATIEEKGYVSILLSFCDLALQLTLPKRKKNRNNKKEENTHRQCVLA